MKYLAIALSLVACLILFSRADAAPKNLIAKFNPSFEKGRTNWAFEFPQTKLPKVVNDSAPSCGTKALQITDTTNPNAITSTMVSSQSGDNYKFTIWVKTNSVNAIISVSDWWAEDETIYGMSHQSQLSNLPVGKWLKVTFKNVAPLNTNLVGIQVDTSTNGGKVSIDCASIQHVQ